MGRSSDVLEKIEKEIDMRSTVEQVKEFHLAFGHPVKDTPDISNVELNRFRLSLIQEEFDELKVALDKGNKVEAFDALLDMQYVLDGAFLALGFYKNKQLGFNEVHQSNMSKLGEDGKPIYREDGKIMKSNKYRSPCLEIYV